MRDPLPTVILSPPEPRLRRQPMAKDGAKDLKMRNSGRSRVTSAGIQRSIAYLEIPRPRCAGLRMTNMELGP